jgi:hypothetical protein
MSERIQGVHPKQYKGVQYKSTLEAETAETLDKLGLPINYEARKIVLLEGFRCPYQKNKVISITYKPDFIVGNIIIECKGFETPEWKIKKKLLFKWLMENEPDTIFYQIHDARKALLEALDPHLTYLGYAVKAEPKLKKGIMRQIEDAKHPILYDSIQQAMVELGLNGKPKGAILRSLTGKVQWVYGYNWKLVKLKL